MLWHLLITPLKAIRNSRREETRKHSWRAQLTQTTFQLSPATVSASSWCAISSEGHGGWKMKAELRSRLWGDAKRCEILRNMLTSDTFSTFIKMINSTRDFFISFSHWRFFVWKKCEDYANSLLNNHVMLRHILAVKMSEARLVPCLRQHRKSASHICAHHHFSWTLAESARKKYGKSDSGVD